MTRREVCDSIFVVDPGKANGGSVCYEATSARALGLKEMWFRDSIAANPELVVAPCRQVGIAEEEWFCWGTEVQVSAENTGSVGNIDVLLVSAAGRVGIVETKLSYNPEARRSVVAQILDYAVNLPRMDLEDLPPIPSDTNKRPVADRREVEEHLSSGDFLLIVAGDELDDRALRLGRGMLGDHMTAEWDLAMIDLALYQRVDNSAGPRCLAVPCLRKAWAVEPRQIVRVILEGETPEHVVRVERIQRPSGESERRSWDEEGFFKALDGGDVAPELKRLARDLVALTKKHQHLSVSWGTGRVGSLTLKRRGSGLIEFFLDGTVRFRPDKFAAALGETLGPSYRSDLERLFGQPMTESRYPHIRPGEVAHAATELLLLIELNLAMADQ